MSFKFYIWLRNINYKAFFIAGNKEESVIMRTFYKTCYLGLEGLGNAKLKEKLLS
jgi:hypothetical protein